MSAIVPSIMAEVRRASSGECRAYLQGAMRDGTFNRLHGTIRIAQADTRWLELLQAVIRRIGSRSWIYREGDRRVWVIKSTCRSGALNLAIPRDAAAFVRGSFDAEGGLPHDTGARFYIQITQTDRSDLGQVRDVWSDTASDADVSTTPASAPTRTTGASMSCRLRTRPSPSALGRGIQRSGICLPTGACCEWVRFPTRA